MTEQEIYSVLTEIFHDVFGDDSLDLTPTLSAADVPKWDSMNMILILVAVEQRLGVKLRSREVNDLGNVGDLVSVIGRRLA
jgi:acyl carrier protein